MSESTTSFIQAPQLGINALRTARVERNNVVAKNAVSQNMADIRFERTERIKKAQEAIETLLSYKDKERACQARQVAAGEIRWLMDVVRSVDGQDREWAAMQAMWFTSWQGMKLLGEVEETLNDVFGENIPEKIAERLAGLIRKQTEYLCRVQQKRTGVLRPGKTARDKESGAHARHEDSRRARAVLQANVATSNGSGGGKGNGKEGGKKK